MSDITERTPIIPKQLEPLMDDQFMPAFERWQDMRLDEVVANFMPEPFVGEHGQAIVLPVRGERDDSSTAVFALAHGQEWKPSNAVRFGLLQDTVMPNTDIVVLTHGPANRLSSAEIAAANQGNLRPFYERKARLLDELDVEGEIVLGGWSLGALMALGIAGVESDRKVITLTADEAPNVTRTAGQLRSDFLKSGGWSAQRQAMRESGLPVIMEALPIGRMALDYTGFAKSTFSKSSRALEAGMAAVEFDQLVAEAADVQDAARLKISRVAGSLITGSFDTLQAALSEDAAERTRIVEYEGAGTHRHSTVDNVTFHALVIKDALVRSA